MVRVVRNITMLLTLLLVVICNMGAICVCQCRGELFTGICSCQHREHSHDCGCHNHADHAKTPTDTPGGTQEAVLAHHECKHVLLTTDEMQVPYFHTTVPEAPANWVEIADYLQAIALDTHAAIHIPAAPDIPPNARNRHVGLLLPLLI